MRRVLLAAALYAATSPVAAAAQAVVVTGTVVDAATSEPLEWVWVGPDTTRTGTLTGPHGSFFLELDPGTESLWARRIGYETVQVALLDIRERVLIEMASQGIALQGLEVQARRAEIEQRLRSAQSVTVVEADEIARLRDQTLGGTIEDIPGVSVIQYGPSIAKPVVRGLHSQRVIVSNAGVRQEGQQWGGEHAPEIDVFTADAISIVRGPGAVEYGSDALGGVVSVEPARLPRGERVTGEFSTQAFANNRQGVISLGLQKGGVEVPLLGTVATRFRITTRRAGDAASPQVNLQNTGFGEFSVSGALGWISDRRRTEVLLSRYDTKLGLFTGAHVGNFDDLERAIERGPRDSEFSYEIGRPYQDVTHDRVLLRHESLIGDVGRLDLSYAFQLNRRREFDLHGPRSQRNEPAFGLDLYTHTVDGAYGIDQDNGLLRFGVSGMRQGNIDVGKSYLIPQYRLYTGGAWLRQERYLGPVTIDAGIRWDYRWQRVFPPPDRAFDLTRTTDDWSDLSGGIGATWEFARGWFLGSYVGRAWRAPNVNERFSQGVHHGTAQYEIGDQTLGREATTSVDASLRHRGDNLSFEVGAFRNAIDNFIYLQPREPVLSIRGAFPAFIFQQTDALMTGLELDAEVGVFGATRVFASGTLVRGDNEVLDEPLYDLPADRLRIGARWSTEAWEGSELTLEASGLLVREQDQVPANTVYSLPTAGYQLLDLGLGWAGLQAGGRRIDLSLDITNVLDRGYRDYLSRYRLFVQDPGRDVVLRAQFPLGG